MAIVKRNGKYYAVVYQGMRDNKQVQTWSIGYDERKSAIAKEIELKKEVLESNHVVTNQESFLNVMESWLEIRKKSVANATYYQNEYYCNHYIKDTFKELMIDEIDTQKINKFMYSLELSPATVTKIMNTLKQIFDLAILYNYIKSNPCNGIRKPRIKRNEVKTWKERDIKEFLTLEDTKNSTGYIAFCILFTTGLRPGEVCGLRWCDLYGDYFIPTVGIDKKRKESALKNEYAHQKIFISRKIQEDLKRLKQYRKDYCKKNGLIFDEKQYINSFEPDFRPMTSDYLRKLIQKITTKNKMEYISPYGARHSLATNMMVNGVNPKKVAEVMRHSTVKTTLDNYSHVSDEMKKNTLLDYSDMLL